jgi:cell division protein FtsI (penicillin-binding protein 3)
MTQILEYSSNIGISFVAKKLGRNLFYNYMKNFGFGERTDFELAAEHPGQIEFFTQWAESELLTHAFGQGILATPLQMVTAISAIANGGLLMQPYIIDSVIEESGKTYPSEPKIIRRVITEETANTLSSMMVSSVENGIAARAKAKKHYIAGKTGTAQTYKHGKALTGAGTTIGSFAGFGPIDDPKFVVLIKVDFALVSPWGSATAAALFAARAAFVVEVYYNIPPDK